MIAKGNLHAHGVKLIDYLLTGERGERMEFGGARGFDDYSPDMREAATRMQQFAHATTRAEKPWFHTQTRLAPGEHLTLQQWENVLDREEKRLGFSGLPRAWSFHIDEASGEKHLHAAWFRVDAEAGVTRDPGLFKRRLMEVARESELEFALREVSGVRQPDDKARAPERKEMEESRRLGTDVRDIRSAILDCLEHSDNGRAFKAALEDRGFVLANGDRRDCFVVIDQEGGHHALNRKLTGLTLAEMRERFADLDRSQLPGVEQAQGIQRDRHSQVERIAALQPEQEQQPRRYDALHKTERQVEAERAFAAAATRTTEPAAPIWDRDAEARAADDRIIGAAIKQAAPAAAEACQRPEPEAGIEIRTAAENPSGGAANRPEPEDMRPLGQTAGDIRMAWSLSRSVAQLDEALAARGITLAEVSREEAEQSQRTAAFAKEVGNFARVLKEGEIVAMNAHGDVYRLDQRTTGDLHPEIEARLSGIDRAGLLSVTDAKEAMQEASRAAWRDARHAERQAARPATGIETAIADTLQSTMTGTEFAAALDKIGLTITRADAADVKALDALRADAALAGAVAHTEGEPITPRHFATLQAGDFAAVNRQGDVFRLNPHKLDFADIEQRLADVQPRLPSVIEARAQNEIIREQAAAFASAQAPPQTAARDEAPGAPPAELIEGIEAALGAGNRAARHGIVGLATAVEKVLSGFFSFFGGGEPKLTRQQQHDRAQAETSEETLHARAYAASEQQKDSERDDRIFELVRQQRDKMHQAEMGYADEHGAAASRAKEREDNGRER